VNNDSLRGMMKDKPEPEEPQSSGAAVEEMTIMSMTVIRKYPNGDTYIDYKKSKQWVQGMQRVQKDKAKVKKSSLKKAIEVTVGKEEVY